MLSVEYKDVIQNLINATTHNKVKWSRSTSPNTFVSEPNNKSKVIIDTYYSQAENTTTCFNLALFEMPLEKLLDEIVICDQDAQPDDYALLQQLYSAARKQFSDEGINPLLTEISASIQ